MICHLINFKVKSLRLAGEYPLPEGYIFFLVKLPGEFYAEGRKQTETKYPVAGKFLRPKLETKSKKLPKLISGASSI